VDAALRTQLGTQARLWWEAHHTIARMRRDYARVIPWAAGLPDPAMKPGLPGHLLPDPAAFAQSLIASFGVDVDVLQSPRLVP
jgi:hypothetical protein